MQFIFSTPVFIRHMSQHKTAVFLHRCLICPVLSDLKYFAGTFRGSLASCGQTVGSLQRTPAQHDELSAFIRPISSAPTKGSRLLENFYRQLKFSTLLWAHVKYQVPYLLDGTADSGCKRRHFIANRACKYELNQPRFFWKMSEKLTSTGQYCTCRGHLG